MKYAIEMHELTVDFPSQTGIVHALDHINLTVPQGQVFGFLGPNGAGKTTAMHVLLGFLPPTSGKAMLLGCDVRQSIARQKIGYLPERPDIYPFLTGREYLSMTGRLFLIRGQKLKTQIESTLDLVGMKESASRRISTYSRGMMQRICFAQAIINDPDLIILDEPTSGLDPIGKRDIRNIIASLKDRGKTVFFSSHELSEVELVCDHIAVLSRGRIVANGKSSNLVPPGESFEKFFMRVITDNIETGS
ncbi:MAG: ABC transporter ATP-binding protein [Kiritimatiellae bacterium]|nr:ABC transporter ATP-binding protein [Kiritimatiellia bacterium]